MKATLEMSAIVAKPTTLSFLRKRESSLSNNLREADKAVFEVLSRFAETFDNRLDSRLRGNDGCRMASVMNYVKINNPENRSIDAQPHRFDIA